MTISKTLLKTLSPVQVAQYLSHVGEHDVEKYRLAALKILVELVEEYCLENEVLHQVVKK
jgi:hypothetical protein